MTMPQASPKNSKLPLISCLAFLPHPVIIFQPSSFNSASVSSVF